ncbi:hypothetical protein OAQ13_01030 [Candidatus Pelagibacter sp.]|nr:hypothetical protein [Candidatus Pelagibacter sp.]MDC0921476.1 hypothetical protein [Candidatus Pelagibacter sp.]
MKRFAIFISLHLFLFLLVIAYHAQSSEWTIDRYKTLSFARVSGEVTHGDNLNFWIRAEDNCEKVYNTFTVYTYEKPGDIKQLLNKNIPIKINGEDITASVQDISPFLMGYRVHLSLGSYPIKEYVYFLKEFYDEFQKYEIEIVDGLNFTASKYFDIRNNSWKLDKLVPSVLKANKLCKEISHKKL